MQKSGLDFWDAGGREEGSFLTQKSRKDTEFVRGSLQPKRNLVQSANTLVTGLDLTPLTTKLLSLGERQDCVTLNGVSNRPEDPTNSPFVDFCFKANFQLASGSL